MERHGQTVEYRTINSVVMGDQVVPENLEKQKEIVAEMKHMAKGTTIGCMFESHLLF